MASHFERRVRIADATGIQWDARMQALSQEVRDVLDLERFTVHKEMGRQHLGGMALALYIDSRDEMP